MFYGVIKKNTWQKLLFYFQWLIPFLSFGLIWIIIENKTSDQSFFVVWTNAFLNISVFSLLGLMFLLTSINIFLEASKWKIAIQNYFSISKPEAIRQTFLSMAAGFITPLKSGSLLARIIANEKADAFTIFNATLRMAIAQFTVTVISGIIGLIYFLKITEQNNWAMLSALFGFCILTLLVFFNKIPFSLYYKNRKWDGIVIDRKLILLSLLRYIVFSLQYLILLYFFGVKGDFGLIAALISITYLVNSVLPTGVMGKLGIRELSGILIIGETTGFIIETSCAAFFIWILNQAFPAIIGSVFFISKNIRG